ncbi:hypothetical protein [Streptomyces sp. BA2]|uniref:hypothetical protein n=1 Tax=Streptomyces sp. BA2 TaxID=436595 RepID=UPI0013225D8E|nr:hypothetical protein [Streptomyces sp. BA2]MWA12561.1 hypothetical protein [Streptomyces sp. BA2]
MTAADCAPWLVQVPPARNGLWCECTLAEPAAHSAREWLLAGYAAPSPRLAVRWLTAQASRLADLIDPPLDTQWMPPRALRVAALRPALDPATALRAWPTDVAEHDQALTAMRDGGLYAFTVTDDRTSYALTARPILTHARGLTPPPQTPAPYRGRPVEAPPQRPFLR